MTIVIDRKTKKVIREPQSKQQLTALRISSFIPSTVHTFLAKQITLRYCSQYTKKKGAEKRIKKFIKEFHIDTDEAEKPVYQYQSLQEFFQRHLKAKARIIASPNDPKVMISPADCRLLVFKDVTEARELWIKGSRFTVEKLLASKTRAKQYKDASLVLCRLAPGDYHRFHFPVTGKYSRTKHIKGNYLSVQPEIVRSTHNVLTENKRTVTYLQTKAFGPVAMILIGATCVGSIVITAKANKNVKKGQEYGTFAFGGSTIVLLIQKNRIKFSADLLRHSKSKVETRVRMGERIGTAVKKLKKLRIKD